MHPLVPSKVSTYLVVLHSKWFTCFSYLNNCLLAFDYEEIAFQKLVKSCNLFVFGHALNCIGKHYSESPIISDFICFKKLFLYLPPIFGGCICVNLSTDYWDVINSWYSLLSKLFVILYVSYVKYSYLWRLLVSRKLYSLTTSELYIMRIFNMVNLK